MEIVGLCCALSPDFFSEVADRCVEVTGARLHVGRQKRLAQFNVLGGILLDTEKIANVLVAAIHVAVGGVCGLSNKVLGGKHHQAP